MSFDPLAPSSKAQRYSTQEALDIINEGFESNTVHELIDHRMFNDLVNAFDRSNFSTLPVKVRPDDPGRGIDVSGRRAILDHFRAAHTPTKEDIFSDSKPPSQPEQYAPPAAKRVLPDSRRKVEGRRPR